MGYGSQSASASGNQKIPVQFLRSGIYTVCVEITGINAWGGFYRTDCTCIERFEIKVKKCCTSYARESNSVIYGSGQEYKIWGEIQAYNAIIYSSIVATTIHYKKKKGKWKRSKTNIGVSMKGNLFDFVGCDFHDDFAPLPKHKKRRSISQRKIYLYKKISGEESQNRCSSGHYLNNTLLFELAIPKCDLIKVYSLS